MSNNQPLEETYVEHIGHPPLWMNEFGPILVPAGEYFVIGDNRDVSLDSRSREFGFVTAGSIAGKPLYVLGSDRIGKALRKPPDSPGRVIVSTLSSQTHAA